MTTDHKVSQYLVAKSKLTAEQKEQIRQEYAQHAQKHADIASKWGVSKSLIWTILNPEKAHELALKHSRLAIARNPEKNRKRAQEWALANPERNRSRARRYYRANPERYVENGRRRRALQAGAVVYPEVVGRHFFREVWPLVVDVAWRGCCAYCCTPFSKTNKPTLDHVYPVTRGGIHAPENWAPACQTCNRSKKDKPLDQWRNGVHAIHVPAFAVEVAYALVESENA